MSLSQPDPAAIERLVVLGGASLVAEVAALFAQHGQVRVDQINDAWARMDLEAVGDAAHSLRSSAAQLGLTGCARLARRLEDGGRAGDVAAVAIAVATLDEEFTRALDGLSSLRSD